MQAYRGNVTFDDASLERKEYARGLGEAVRNNEKEVAGREMTSFVAEQRAGGGNLFDQKLALLRAEIRSFQLQSI